MSLKACATPIDPYLDAKVHTWRLTDEAIEGALLHFTSTECDFRRVENAPLRVRLRHTRDDLHLARISVMSSCWSPGLRLRTSLVMASTAAWHG